MLPSVSYTFRETIDGVERVAAANGIELGPITVRPDPVIEKIGAGWATHSEASRVEALGLPNDRSLDRVIQDYIDDFMSERTWPRLPVRLGSSDIGARAGISNERHQRCIKMDHRNIAVDCHER
jgi:hypothetical protein